MNPSPDFIPIIKGLALLWVASTLVFAVAHRIRHRGSVYRTERSVIGAIIYVPILFVPAIVFSLDFWDVGRLQFFGEQVDAEYVSTTSETIEMGVSEGQTVRSTIVIKFEYRGKE